MVTILSSPPEVMALIFANLNPFELETVMKTFNRQLYSIASALYEQDAAWVKNSRVMCARFKLLEVYKSLPSFPGHLPPLSDAPITGLQTLSAKYCAWFGNDPARGPFLHCSPPDFRSWLNMDGNLEWLDPLEEKIENEMRLYNGTEENRSVATSRQIDILVEEVTGLGLHLPSGFEKFLRSDELQYRIPSSSAWFFQLSKLIKVPSEVDRGAGGFMIRFYWDQQGCAFAYLYLDTSGGHCVLVSTIDIYQGNDEIGNDDPVGMDDDDNDMEEETFKSEDFFLVGLSFEEYLASVYFEGLLFFSASPFFGLNQFVAHNYRSPVEVEHLKETRK
jgi:hypothetical protein